MFAIWRSWDAWGVSYACVVFCACAVQANVMITQVAVDGKAMPHVQEANVVGGGLPPLRLNDSARHINFRFENVGGSVRPAMRLRYKLEGYDKQWIDLPMRMRVLLYFRDEEPKIVGQHEFFLEGETPGWTGNPETSAFVTQREILIVPERARNLRLSFVSHGGDVGVGVVAVDGIRIVVEPVGSGAWRTNDLSFIPEKPNRWIQEGSRSEIARTGKRASPSSRPILILDDDDALNYGNWSLAPPYAVPVQPGERLTVEWETAYSIGDSAPGGASYATLKPGSYVFRVAAFQANGEPTGVECALPVLVSPVFYRRTEFWLVLLALVIAGAALIARAVEVARVHRRVAAMEHEQALERERSRIARDLHDEMGAGLSAIAMQSDWIRRECAGTASPETRHRIETVCQSSVELVRSVDEIVWAVNPSNDTLERFVNYLTQYTEQYLDAAGLRFRFDIPRELPAALLTGSMRHNLFLAVKEALRNAVKHAKAELIWLRMNVESAQLTIIVEDNGKGFDPAGMAGDGTHNGVGNMRRRMEEVSGTFEVWSQPGKGARVTFAVPLV